MPPAGPSADRAATLGRDVRAGFDPRKALRAVGVFGAVGLGLSALAATTGMGVPCPFRSVTGLLCPLCGGTHLGVALLHGDVATAFAANPLLLVVLVLLAVVTASWAVEVAGGPALRPPAWVRRQSARLGPIGWATLLLGLGLTYAFLRNLLPL